MDIRVMMTQACDMACKYCINNTPGVLDQFQRYDNFLQIQWHDYDCIKLTGGEPFVLPLVELQAWIHWIRHAGGRKIVIYTNGLQLDRMDKPPAYIDVDGYSIGIHEEYMHPMQYVHLHEMLSTPKTRVRFLAIQEYVSPNLLRLAKKHRMDLTLLRLGEKCDNDNEVRVRI